MPEAPEPIALALPSAEAPRRPASCSELFRVFNRLALQGDLEHAGGLVALLTVIPASVALPSDALTAVRRHGKAGLWMVLAITRLFLEGVEPALRGNAKLHSTGILVALAGSVAGDVVLGLSGAYWVQAGGKVLLMGLPVAACWWWLQMRPAGESFTPTPGPTLEELDGEMERIQEEIRAYRKAAGGE